MKSFASFVLACVLAVSALGACLGGEQMTCCETMPDCANTQTAAECCLREGTSHQDAVATVKTDAADPLIVLPVAVNPLVPPHPVSSVVEPINRYYTLQSPAYIRHHALLI